MEVFHAVKMEPIWTHSSINAAGMELVPSYLFSFKTEMLRTCLVEWHKEFLAWVATASSGTKWEWHVVNTAFIGNWNNKFTVRVGTDTCQEAPPALESHSSSRSRAQLFCCHWLMLSCWRGEILGESHCWCSMDLQSENSMGSLEFSLRI